MTCMIASGSVLGDLLDLHAAVARGDDAHAFGLTVEHEAEIEFALEGLGDFDIDALDGFALGPVWLVTSGVPSISRPLRAPLIGLAELDAAGLAARRPHESAP